MIKYKFYIKKFFLNKYFIKKYFNLKNSIAFVDSILKYLYYFVLV